MPETTLAEQVPNAERHFVYVYRDRQRNPIYIGRGETLERAWSHQGGSHNAAFNRWLAANPTGYTVEFLGPLGSDERAADIEAILIDTCKPAQALGLLNKASGPERYRLKPLGVPLEYAGRRNEPALAEADWKALAAKVGIILFVRITVIQPPPDTVLIERATRWWQLSRFVPAWAAAPQSSPALLIGVSGGPGAQMIMCSFLLDQRGWATAATRPHGLMEVPTIAGPTGRVSLDALELRGRAIGADLKITFGRFRDSVYHFFGPDGFVAGLG